MFLQDSSALHPREGGDPGGLVACSEYFILDPRLREDDEVLLNDPHFREDNEVLFALKFVISNFFPRVFGVVALRKAQGDALCSSKNV